MDAPWSSFTAKQRKTLLYGSGSGRVHVKYRNRYGRVRSYHATYEGAVPWLQRRHSESDSDAVRDQIEGYMREVPCPACGGARLKPLSLASRSTAAPSPDLCSLSIGEAAKVLSDLDLSERDRMIAERVIKEVNARMGFLLDVGLDYLTLSRSAATLAGGEAQRIRLASQIGSGLVGVLYVLDEPSIGLHQRDNRRLIETLMRLRELGNTVLVVEHDEETIRVADYIVDIGPGAGEHGGGIVVRRRGRPACSRTSESITGQYLSGKRSIPLPRAAAPRRRTAARHTGGSRAQPAEHRRRDPARRVRVRHGRVGVGQVDADQRHAVPRPDAEGLQVPGGAGPAPPHRRHRARRQGDRRRPVADRAHAALQPGHLHRRVRPDPPAVQPDRRRHGSAAICPGASAST